MTHGFWILDEHGSMKQVDLMTWAKWFEVAENRIMKQEWIGGSKVSTVFLGIDHNFLDGAPILWETMVFGGPLNGEMERCGGNKEQSEAMHQKMVERVQSLEGAKNGPKNENSFDNDSDIRTW